MLVVAVAPLQDHMVVAAMSFFGRLAPNPNLPWRDKQGIGARIWRALVWTIGAPFCFLAYVGDHVFQGFFRKAGRSNTYRVGVGHSHIQ